MSLPSVTREIQLAQVDLRGNGGVGQVGLFLAAHQPEGGVEAGGVSGCEELLRVGPLAASAQFDGAGQGDIQLAVVGPRSAVASFARGECLGSVEGFHGLYPSC